MRELRPWLYRIAHNAAINALKKVGEAIEQVPESVGGFADRPATELERRDEMQHALDQHRRAAARQRTALLAVAVDGRAHADVAQSSGSPTAPCASSCIAPAPRCAAGSPRSRRCRRCTCCSRRPATPPSARVAEVAAGAGSAGAASLRSRRRGGRADRRARGGPQPDRDGRHGHDAGPPRERAAAHAPGARTTATAAGRAAGRVAAATAAPHRAGGAPLDGHARHGGDSAATGQRGRPIQRRHGRLAPAGEASGATGDGGRSRPRASAPAGRRSRTRAPPAAGGGTAEAAARGGDGNRGARAHLRDAARRRRRRRRGPPSRRAGHGERGPSTGVGGRGSRSGKSSDDAPADAGAADDRARATGPQPRRAHAGQRLDDGGGGAHRHTTLRAASGGGGG